MSEVRSRKPDAAPTDKSSASKGDHAEKSKTGHLAKPLNITTVNILLVLSLVFTVGSIYHVHVNVRTNDSSMSSLVERIGFTLRCLGVSSVVSLTVIIFMTMMSRGNQIELTGNPLQGNDHLGSIQLNQRILQNTLEQLAIHTLSLLSLATYLGPATIKFIPLLCAFFTVGRFFFWLGYPRYRTFGFVMTMMPTLVAIGFNIYLACKFGLASSSGAADAIYA